MPEIKWEVTLKDGTPVQAGDKITDFRGDVAVFQYVSAAPLPRKSAKVVVDYPGWDGREVFQGVFDLIVRRAA